MASIPQAAQLLGVDKATIYRWLRDGFITGQQPTPGAPWRIRIDQALRDRVRPAVPDGWLPLDQAAKMLGISRQTVLHKVQTRPAQRGPQSPKDAAKACVSRSNTNSLDCSTHHGKRKAQC